MPVQPAGLYRTTRGLLALPAFAPAAAVLAGWVEAAFPPEPPVAGAAFASVEQTMRGTAEPGPGPFALAALAVYAFGLVLFAPLKPVWRVLPVYAGRVAMPVYGVFHVGCDDDPAVG